MTMSGAATGVRRPPGRGEQRLIVRDQPETLADHLSRHGPLPQPAARALIDEVERSGLTGRGGGAFPAGRKLRAVAAAAGRTGAGRGAGSVIVANGSESEPASDKDAVLLSHVPHLVLDGITLCAGAVGASRSYLCLGPRGRAAAGPLER
jgi:NADH:ubiquinone oxidoreductase subunit F (NADH-binding)